MRKECFYDFFNYFDSGIFFYSYSFYLMNKRGERDIIDVNKENF